MTSRRLLPLTLAVLALVIALVLSGLLIVHPAARALPPAGTDYVYATADVLIKSRIGTETVHLEGTATILRQDLHLESGVQVVDDQITSLSLAGNPPEGHVTVNQSFDLSTTGEIRSQHAAQEYPADASFDAYLEVHPPTAGAQVASVLHNQTAIHLANAANITTWPPYGVDFTADPTETGTHCSPSASPPGPGGIALFPPPDYPTPQPGQISGDPLQICIIHVTITLSVPPTPTPTLTLTPTVTPCVPTCTPTPTPTGPPPTATRTPFPTPTPTRTPGPFPPGDTTFSVGRGGPSGLHPADLIARGASTAPIPVSGNDLFAQAYEINALPFIGSQSMLAMSVETGEPTMPLAPTATPCVPTCTPTPTPVGTPTPDYCIGTSPHTKGATSWYKFTAHSNGTVDVDTSGSSYDTVLSVYTGSALNALTMAGCDDDSGTGLTSFVSFTATSGTAYYVQAGGFSSATGDLRITISMAGSSGASVVGVHTAVSCANLGLTAAGCSSTGTQDDLDALSFGHDFASGNSPFQFSVAPGSAGLAGSAVAAQAACSPPEPQADMFSSERDGTNALILDGDGAANGCPIATPANLIERPNSDNLNASSGQPPDLIDTDNDGQLDLPVYFSLSAGSPSLATYSRGPADILWTTGFSPGVYASAGALGLQAADDIDALCVTHPGAGQVYDATHDKVLFSLAPGSPTLASLGASAADILAPGPKVAVHAWELGLNASDNVDALNCAAQTAPPTVIIPTGSFYFCNLSYQGGVCDTVVHAGDTVTWNFLEGEHTTTECGASCDNAVPSTEALWDSGVVIPGHSYSRLFTTPGTYLYYCQIHPTVQRGRIIVQPAGGPTATPTLGGPVGDANGDGLVNSIDAALVLQFTAGLTSSIHPSADANQDEQVNAIDATLILQYVAGLLSHLPP